MMDTYIGYIIPQIPYLWLDTQQQEVGLKGWAEGRFIRRYLVKSKADMFFSEYFVLPALFPQVCSFFKAQDEPVAARHFPDVRMNGKRVRLESLFPRETLQVIEKTGLSVLLLYDKLRLAYVNVTPQSVTLLQGSSGWPRLIPSPDAFWLKNAVPFDVNYTDFKVTDVGLYSLTRWRDAIAIIDRMASFVRENLKDVTITDGTAGVGGDLLQIIKRFGRVNAVELLPLHCAVAAHNLSIFCVDFPPVSIICANYVDVVEFYRKWTGPPVVQDVVYLDPPWGGPEYWKKKKVQLQLDGVPLHLLVTHILKSGIASYVFVKAPKNVDFHGYPSFTSFNIGKMKLLCFQ